MSKLASNVLSKFLDHLFGRRTSSDSEAARRAIHDAYVRSGGPTPGLVRLYGGYLEHKRTQKAAKATDGE